MHRAADALVEGGYEIVEACPPRYEEAIVLWRQFVLGDFAAVLDLLLPMMGRDGQTFLMTVNSTASPPDYKAMSQLFISRHGIARAWSEFLARYPLMLTPTWTKLPFEHGFDVATPEGTAATMELLRPTLPANLLGLPSACVSAGADEATGLPIGELLNGSSVSRGSLPRCRRDHRKAVLGEDAYQSDGLNHQVLIRPGWAQIERPPRGGVSEIHAGVLIRRLLSQPCSSASYASRPAPARRGRWRTAGGPRGERCYCRSRYFPGSDRPGQGRSRRR